MHVTLDRAAREDAVRQFGNARVLEGINRLYRKFGLGFLPDDVLNLLHDWLDADEKFSERVKAENRARAAAVDPDETRRVVAEASVKVEAHLTQALLDRLAHQRTAAE